MFAHLKDGTGMALHTERNWKADLSPAPPTGDPGEEFVLVIDFKASDTLAIQGSRVEIAELLIDALKTTLETYVDA